MSRLPLGRDALELFCRETWLLLAMLRWQVSYWPCMRRFRRVKFVVVNCGSAFWIACALLPSPLLVTPLWCKLLPRYDATSCDSCTERWAKKTKKLFPVNSAS